MRKRVIGTFSQKAVMASCCAVCLFLLGACASEKTAENNEYAEIKVKGVSGDLLFNINSYLESLPKIPKEKLPMFERGILDKVRLAMRSYGYYHPAFQLDYPKDKSSELLVNIDPGKPLFIRFCDVEVIGEGAFYPSFAKIIEQSGVGSYTRLSHSGYENLKNALRDKALQLGFFDAKLMVSRIIVYKEQNAADIEIIYDTGKRYKYGQVVSDESTKELMKPSSTLFSLTQGRPFNSAEVSSYITSLSQTNYYKSVDVRPLVEQRDFGTHGVPISMDLKRREKNAMRLGIGFSTDENARLLMSWDKPLISSKGHSFSSYFRISRVKYDAQVIYKIPRKNPNLDYYYIKLAQTHTDFNDTLSDLSHASFHYVANMTGKWRRDFSLAAEYEDYKQGIERGNAKNIIPGILLSHRESSGGFDPRLGYNLSLETTFGTALLSDYNFARTILTFKGVLSPSDNTRFLYSLQQGTIFGEDSRRLPPSMRFFAGGDQSVRGFSYKSRSNRLDGYLKGGRYLSLASAEFQFPIGIQNSRAAVFIDAGTACDDYSDASLLLGPGIGYRYISSYGTVKVDLALGIDNKENDRNVKLHFQFGPEF